MRNLELHDELLGRAGRGQEEADHGHADVRPDVHLEQPIPFRPRSRRWQRSGWRIHETRRIHSLL